MPLFSHVSHQIRQWRDLVPKALHASIRNAGCLVSSCDGLAGHMIPPHNTLAVQKPRAGLPTPARVPGLLDPSTHPESELVCAGLQMVRAVLDVGWPAMLAALFGGVLWALQTLARAAVSHYPLHVTRPSPQLAKAALSPHVISAFDDPPPTPPPRRSPVSLEVLCSVFQVRG